MRSAQLWGEKPALIDAVRGRWHCHVNRKIIDQRTMAVTVHAATVAWGHVSIRRGIANLVEQIADRHEA